MQFRKISTKRFKWANLQHFRVTHPLRIPDRWDFIVFSFFCLPFYYSVLEYREDISHLNLTPDFIYICIYPEQKKKGKKERKGRKKSRWHFHQPFHQWAHIFWSLGWRTGLCSYFSLGYSWGSHDACIFLAIIVFESMYFLCSITKYMFYLLNNGEKTLNSSNASKTWFVLFSRSVVSTLFAPMDCSTSGFPVLHYLLELAQTRVHWIVLIERYWVGFQCFVLNKKQIQT